MPEVQMRVINPLRFLFNQYSPEFWYWEVIETVRRIALTGFLVLIKQGSGLQIVMGILITLVFVKLYGIFGPFEDAYVDADAEMAQYQIFGILFIALLLKDETIHGSSGILDILLVVITLSFILLSVFRVMVERRKIKKVYKKFITNAPKEPHSFINPNLIPTEMRSLSDKAPLLDPKAANSSGDNGNMSSPPPSPLQDTGKQQGVEMVGGKVKSTV